MRVMDSSAIDRAVPAVGTCWVVSLQQQKWPTQGETCTFMNVISVRLSPQHRFQQNTDTWNQATFASGALLLLILVMSVITWRKWGDLTIDVDREMNIPAVLRDCSRLYF